MTTAAFQPYECYMYMSLGVLQFEFYVVKGGATNQDMALTETC